MTTTFQQIVAWQKAHSFVLSVYEITGTFPKEEQYGLVAQFRRAAVSIAANIAEGYRKLGKSDKLRFLNIAQGSLEECRYYILLAHDLHFITLDVYKDLLRNIDGASVFLNSYAKGIKENAAIAD